MALTPEEQLELEELEAKYGNSVMNPNRQPPGFLEQFGQATLQNLPELGGMAGGAAALLATRNPAVATLGRTAGTQAIRSLIGAGVGGSLGEATSQAITGESSPVSVLRSGVEQAVYDGAGNLFFSYAGKGYQLAKKQVSNLIGKEAPDSAIKAAQELITQQKTGGTLTQFQVKPTAVNSVFEGIARSSFLGKPLFVQTEKNVAKAIESAKINILDDISRDVYEGFKIGDDFAVAISKGDEALKARVSPFYQQLDEAGKGVQVNIGPIQSYANQVLSKAEGLNKLTLADKETKLLTDIAELPNTINFSQAHDLLSSFKTRLRDMKKTDTPDTPTLQRLTQVVKNLEGVMDSAGSKLKGTAINFDGKLAEDGAQSLADQYKLYSNFYRESINDLYTDTTARILNNAPEFIGNVVFQNGSVTAFRDLQKSLARAKKLNPELSVEDTVNSVRRGYLESLLQSGSSFAGLSDKLKNDPKLRATFTNILDKDQQKRVTTLLDAAKFSQETPQSVAPLFVASQQAGAVVQGVGALGALALVFSDDAQSFAQENPKWSALGLGSILLGPRFIAKAATNPESANVTLGILKKAKNNEPIGKNLLLKTLEVWERAGIEPSDLQAPSADQPQAPQPAIGLTPEEQAELEELEAKYGAQ